MNVFIKFRAFSIIRLCICLALTAGCALDMRDQPRYEPFEQSTFFADTAIARPRVPGTVARGQLNLDEHLHTGRIDRRLVDAFPFPITRETIERGQERYEIFCTPCHGLTGDGLGIVIEYGMRRPTSFHDEELRAEPHGYYFATITNGTRVMPSFAANITPADRWAIVAYVRALQLSQNADVSDISAEDLRNLE